MERERGVWKALSITMIVTQRSQVEEREGDGKMRESASGERKRGGGVHDDHDSNVCYFNYPVSVLIVSFLFYYLSFQRINNPTFSLVNDHLHKSIEH